MEEKAQLAGIKVNTPQRKWEQMLLVLGGGLVGEAAEQEPARIQVLGDIGQELGHQIPGGIGADADEDSVGTRAGAFLPFGVEASF